MPYVNGYCPVDPGDEVPFVIAVSGRPPVLLYCPMCEVAGVSREEFDTTNRHLSSFGLDETCIRYATGDEIRSAGLSSTGQSALPWPLPRSD